MIENNEKKAKYLKGLSGWMNIIYSSNGIIFKSAVYTKKLINLMGYDVDDFVKLTLTYGLRPLFKEHPLVAKKLAEKTFRKLYCFEFDIFQFEDNMITKYGGMVRVNNCIGVLCQLYDNNIVTKHFMKLSLNDEDIRHSVIQEPVKENGNIKNIQVEKEHQEFIDKFYTPKVIPKILDDESKICKIKVLTEDEQTKFMASIDKSLLIKYFPNLYLDKKD